MKALIPFSRVPRPTHTGFRSITARILIGALALTPVAIGTYAATAGATSAGSARDVNAFGDAKFLGSTGSAELTHPIVGMASTTTRHGYWLVASDGGIFSFGDAHFYGSTGAIKLNQPIVGIAATPTGHGYRLVAGDGGIFSFGDAHFYGSTGGTALGSPVAGIATTPSGKGYWIATANGQVFGYGDASRLATQSESSSTDDVVAIVAGPDARGYWLASAESFGQNPKTESAIAWFQARLGSSAFEELCETAVENAYGTTSQYPSAIADWDARPDKHSDWQNAPRGALVFYDTSGDGHVAISLGDGTVISTSVEHRIGIAPTGFFQNPLGWASAPW